MNTPASFPHSSARIGQPSSLAPPVATLQNKFPITLEGTVRPYVCNIPDDQVLCLSSPDCHVQVFLVAWMDKNRGEVAHVAFPSTGAGKFTLGMLLHDQDSRHLKVQACMRFRDKESNNTRSITLAVSASDLTHLLQGHTDSFRMYDQFSDGNYVDITLSVKNALDYANHPDSPPSNPRITFGPSALDHIGALNDSMGHVSSHIMANLCTNTVCMPPGTIPFKKGITSREFGGRVYKDGEPNLTIPMLVSHYAIMHAQENVLDRTLPIPVFVFHVTLKLTHSGLTAEQALALDDRQFGTFYPQTAQITCDSGLSPYERDYTTGLTVNKVGLMELTQVSTENIACPCTISQMAGRVIRDVTPIEVARGTSVEQIMAMFDTPPPKHVGTRLLDGRVHLTAEGSFTPWELPDMYTSVVMDDCETTSLVGRLALKTSLSIGASHAPPQGVSAEASQLHTDASAQEIRDACQHWPVFKNFTAESWTLMAKIINRGNAMLRCNHLRVMATVGLASTAAASDTPAGHEAASSLNGHCFNVGFLQTPSMPTPECMLLEGTACMIQYKTTESTPKVTVMLTGVVGGSETKHDFDMATFLTLFAGTVLFMSGVINSPNGGGVNTQFGLPFKRKITGWLAKTMVMKTLDSSPSFALPFYNRILYCGWPCTNDGMGCMPVEGIDSELLAGCHPYSLPHQDLRGISAGIPAGQVEMMRQVMDETTPPMADPALFQKISAFWEPSLPLEAVNKDMNALLTPGVRYTRVAAMETPGAPEYIPLLFELKLQLVELTNKINASTGDSDGIVGHVRKMATGVHVLLDVPDRSFRLTFVRSMKLARAVLNWPSLSTPSDGAIHHG